MQPGVKGILKSAPPRFARRLSMDVFAVALAFARSELVGAMFVIAAGAFCGLAILPASGAFDAGIAFLLRNLVFDMFFVPRGAICGRGDRRRGCRRGDGRRFCCRNLIAFCVGRGLRRGRESAIALNLGIGRRRGGGRRLRDG